MNKVAIWTDGHGSYQARCMDCEWRSPWRRAKDKAVQDAKVHGQQEVAK